MTWKRSTKTGNIFLKLIKLFPPPLPELVRPSFALCENYPPPPSLLWSISFMNCQFLDVGIWESHFWESMHIPVGGKVQPNGLHVPLTFWLFMPKALHFGWAGGGRKWKSRKERIHLSFHRHLCAHIVQCVHELVVRKEMSGAKSSHYYLL